MSFDDLIAYLDTRFGETSQRFERLQEQMDTRFSETSQQFAALQEQTSRRFEGLQEQTSRRFEGLQEQITSLREEFASQREENNRRFENLEEESRQTRVLIESLDGKIRLVAEGVSNVNEKLDAVKAELKDEISEVRELLMRSRRFG